MKKNIFAVLLICALSLPVFAAEEVQTAVYGHSALPEAEQQKKSPELPQPYDEICRQLSNGKDDLLAALRRETAPYAERTELEVLERIGAAASGMYSGDPLLGAAKFCRTCLDGCETVEAQAKAVSAFIRGYKSCGVAIISFAGCDKEPVTKADISTGKFAWFVPFKKGGSVQINIFGKTGETVKFWKILDGKSAFKEWQGGFWEREITINGK